MKKITFLLLFVMVCSFSFAQTFPGTGTPVDTQNGQINNSATCGTAFELNLTVDVTGIGVLGAALVLDQIDLDIAHTWSGDVVVTLIAPDGTTLIDVTSGNGGGGDNYVGTQFRDDATTPITAGAAPFAGVFNPEQPLSTFNGVDADGTWTLNFCDSANGDIGTFNSWSINFAPPPSCANPTNLTGVVLTASTAELSWIASGTETLWDIEVVDITGGGSVTGTPTATGVTNPYMGMGLTEGNDYEAYVRADCGVDGTSDWVGPFAWGQNVPPPNDLPAGAIPITPSAEGTGCATATFALPFSTDFTTDSGAQGGCSDSGLDQFFSWTATTDGLTFTSGTLGAPGIVVWDALTLAEIDCAATFATDAILGGWTIGQDLVIQIYDFAGSLSDVEFCLEEYTFPTIPNCAETPISPADTAIDVLIPGTVVTLAWTAPSTGPAPTDYEVLFGDTSGALNNLGALGSTGTTVDITGLDFATTYYWQIVPLNGASAASACAEWSFTTEATPPPPANDDCANAEAIVCAGQYIGDTTTATPEDPDPGTCGTSAGTAGAVWYTFTGANSNDAGAVVGSVGDEVTLDLSLSTFDTKIRVFEGVCGALVCVDGDDDGGTGTTSLLILPTLVGTEYYVLVHGFSANSGVYTLDVSCIAPPLCSPAVVDSSTIVDSCNPDGTGTFTVDIVVSDAGDAGSVFDDGTTTYPVVVGTVTAGPYNSGDSVTIELTAVDTACSATVGTFDFTCPQPPPANNDCASALSVTQETGILDAASATATPGTIESATDSGLAAELCNGFTGTANDDVWYAFEALTTDVNITYEIAFDGVAQLYSGTCGALIAIDCADSTFGTGPQEEIQATGLTVGEIYYTRIYQWGTGNTAGLTFNFKLWSPSVLGTEEFDNEAAFTYYPNPVKNTLTLSAQNTIEQVAMYNMLGQEVLRATPNTVDSDLDMSNLQTGTYFVKVTIGNVTKTIRVIKQ